MTLGLSKSKYCRGVQCPKMLWMDKHMADQASDMDLEAVMTTGLKVGDVARKYFGGYSLVEYDEDKSAMAEKTKRLMAEGAENIAEASFVYDGLFCAVDILHRDEDGYDIVEVKSATSVKDIYIDDMAFQYYLLTKCGVNVKKVFLMHIDSSYVRHGDLELDKLFALEDCTERVTQSAEDVEKNIVELRAYVDTDAEPERDIGEYCSTPYACAYYGYCSRHLPNPSIFDVCNLRNKFKYYHQGIVSFEDIIKSGLQFPSKQMQQIETAYYHKPDTILSDEIKAFLGTLSYPLYHLDEYSALRVPAIRTADTIDPRQ